MDRHILKAMYGRLDSPPPERKAKPSCLGALREEAANLLSDLAVPVMAAYWYLKILLVFELQSITSGKTG